MSNRKTTLIVSAIAFLAFAVSSQAATRTWDNVPGGDWSNGLNWGTTAPVSGDSVALGTGLSYSATQNIASLSLGKISGSASTATQTITNTTGTAITLTATDGTGFSVASSALTMNSSFILGNSQKWVAGGTSTIGASGYTLDLAGFNLDFTGAKNTYNIGSQITGTGNLSFNSQAATATGTWTLSNTANNFVGDVTINSVATAAGGNTLRLLASGVITDTATINFTNTGGGTGGASLDMFGNSETVNGLSSTYSTAVISNSTSLALATLTIGSNNATASYNGKIGTGTGLNNIKLVKVGTGTQTLSGANAYSGLTDIQNGTLLYGAANVINAGAVTVSGGTLDMATFADTVGAVTLTGGTISGSAASGLTSTSGFTVEAGTVNAILNGGVALNKNTGGLVTLNGNDLYTGVTNVNQGILSVNGTHTGGGLYTVAAAATLRGTGNIAANIDASGNIAPGNSIGTLLVTGDADLTAGTLQIEINGANTDVLNVSGLLDIAGGTVDFSSVNLTANTYVFAKYGTINGTFGTVNNLPGGYSIDYAYNDGSSTHNIALIPEPASLALLLAGGFLVLGRNRRRVA